MRALLEPLRPHEGRGFSGVSTAESNAAAAILDALVTTLGCDPVDAANVARAISITLAEPESVTPRYRAAVRAGLLDAQ